MSPGRGLDGSPGPTQRYFFFLPAFRFFATPHLTPSRSGLVAGRDCTASPPSHHRALLLALLRGLLLRHSVLTSLRRVSSGGESGLPTVARQPYFRFFLAAFFFAM